MHVIMASWQKGVQTTALEKQCSLPPLTCAPREEDWAKLSPNSDIQLTDYMNCDDNELTSERLSINKICDAAENTKEDGVDSEGVEEEVPIPTFGEATASFEAV
jgi:hypothetical protein